MKCQLSIGIQFRKWIAEDVITTIRKINYTNRLWIKIKEIAIQDQQVMNQNEHIATRNLAMIDGSSIKVNYLSNHR
jgi:prophage antirepressor-like protein